MNAEIITIGDEILIGQIIDTNSAWLAEKLNLIGINIHQITSISDSEEHLIEALNQAKKKSQLIITTGGLGPTDDDKTKDILTKYFNTKLVVNKDVLKDVTHFIESRGLRTNSQNIKQAEVPKICKVIRNGNGTAPGIWIEKDNTVFVSMPAVPFEMKEMTETKLIPLLQKHFKTPSIVHKTVQTFGMPESTLAEILYDWENKLPTKIKLAYLPSPERIRLRLSCISNNKVETEQLIDTEIQKLEKIIGKAIFGYGDMFLEHAVAEILKEKGKILTTAESCTGGSVARLLTSISGSSEYFRGGLVAYSNKIKNKILGVKSETLEKYGAVSQETVEEMAKGALKLFDADYAVAISGIAGPGGATEDKPVGTTWIAVADKDKVYARKFIFGTRRAINIRRASAKSLDMVRKFILGYYSE